MDGVTGRPPDGGLGDRLRREADRHVPDTDRIRRRLDGPGASRTTALMVALHRRGLTAAATAAAATLLLVVGTSVVAVRAGDRAGPPAAPPAPVPATSAAPIPTPGDLSPGPDPAGPLSGPDRTAARTPPTRTAGGRTPAAGSPVPPSGPTTSPTTPVVRLELLQVPVGTRVALGPGGLDWMVPGAAATVVGRAGTGLPAPEVRGGTTGVPGPYRVTWTGGAPVAAGTGAPGWTAVEATGGVTIRVPAAPGRRQVRLYVGTSGADVTAEVRVGAERRTVTLAAPAPAGIMTITAESATEPVVVDLIGVGRAAGGRFGLAAVTVGPAP